MGGVPAGKLSEEDLPAVGDWVAVRPLDGERKAVIEAVLPRRTSFTRKEASTRTVEQVVAANVDTVFVVTAFGFDLNPRRLERYLTSAWDSGSSPVVVVNKSDVAADPEAELLEVEPVTMGVALHAVSAVTGEGLEALDPYLEPGKTVALLGSSGVGKSTLVNRWAGQRFWKPPRRVQAAADGTPRVIASSCRCLRRRLLDTPGMRELQLWADEDVLDTTFSEISDFAAQCRFSDCSHEREPGCAIRQALNDGTLSRERWDSYCKLQRELRALAIRKDGRLRSQARKERAKFARSRRKTVY
jgi:ribosome biogenesis GTPase